MKMGLMKRYFSVFLVIAIGFSVAGCGSDNSSYNGANAEESSVQTPKPWLDDWSAEASLEAQQAFDSFKYTKDSFEGESFLDLPKKELSPITINKPIFRLNIFSGPSTQDVYLPLLIVAYLGEDWQFYDGLKMKFGDNVREFKMLNDPDRDASGGSISEILSFLISKEDAKFLSQVFTLGNPEIRLSGSKQFFTDVQFSTIELENLKKVLLAYKYIVNSDIKP
jgi:hypothetical protein